MSEPAQSVTTVVAAALVHHGRVLAARRAYPADVAGGWELPGGKVDRGETSSEAIVRELREELGCTVTCRGSVGGDVPIKPGYVLTVWLAELVKGEPLPHEHDAIRWLGPEDLDDVAWLPADRPFLPQLAELLLEGETLEGGNVGGAVRIGRTVRRPSGPWTDAVHGLLRHLRAGGMVEAPDVLGTDQRGREVLSFLPGRVPVPELEIVPDETLVDAMRWVRRFHAMVADHRPDVRWRNVARALEADEIICYHDFATYNVALSTSPTGERVVGAFDWDMAGPGRPVEDLSFGAWNWVPLTRDIGAAESARRLQLMATAYDGDITAGEILEGVVPRTERALATIAAGQAARDPGMLNLGKVGEPERTARTLAQLVERLPEIRRALRS